LATKNNQIAEKDRQITTYSTQLTTAQSQLRDKDGQLTVSREEVRRVTELFNNLQIENNNKDNEIKTKEEKIVSLKVKLGEAEEDILSRELVSKEKKLDELTRDLAIEPPQRVKELREAYERLIKAREDYNRNGVAAAQRDIDERKQELLQTNISVDNLYKVYRNCEKVAELRIKLEKIHEQRFEARQEVPTNN
jgi:chromosome segregation ATPase